MKTLKDLEENIYKCSKCGLCQKVCPIYKATGNECTLSRGKFTLLNGVIKKHIKMNKDVMKYVDLCLNCNACKNFCPSNIDAREIFTSIKAEKENSKRNFFSSHFLLKIGLNFAAIAFWLYRLLKINKIVNKIANLLIKNGKIGRFLLIIDTLSGPNIKRKKQGTETAKATVVYFPGCVNKYINTGENNAVLNILEKLNYKVITPNFECCGMSYYSKGQIHEFTNLVNKNLELLPERFDFFVTDCASCDFTLSKYEEFADKKYLEKAKLIRNKAVSFVELLAKQDNVIKNSTPINVTFHKPCHFDGDVKQILSKIENINYVEMKDYDTCCGAAGSFMIKYPQISKDISIEKAQNIVSTNADIVLTSCPSCVVGLKRGLVNIGDTKTKVMNISEFVGSLIQ